MTLIKKDTISTDCVLANFWWVCVSVGDISGEGNPKGEKINRQVDIASDQCTGRNVRHVCAPSKQRWKEKNGDDMSPAPTLRGCVCQTLDSPMFLSEWGHQYLTKADVWLTPTTVEISNGTWSLRRIWFTSETRDGFGWIAINNPKAASCGKRSLALSDEEHRGVLKLQ